MKHPTILEDIYINYRTIKSYWTKKHGVVIELILLYRHLYCDPHTKTVISETIWCNGNEEEFVKRCAEITGKFTEIKNEYIQEFKNVMAQWEKETTKKREIDDCLLALARGDTQ